MGVGVVRITVGADQNLMPRPGTRRELQGQGVGVSGLDGGTGVEGLGELVEEDAVRLSIDLLRQHELIEGTVPAAVDAADKITAGEWIMDLFLLPTVVHDAVHSAGTLPVFGDTVQSRHGVFPIKARS